MAKKKVKSHSRKTKKGRVKVKGHSRSIKSKVAEDITKMHPSLSKKDASHLFDMTMNRIKTDIKKEKRVSIKDFGTFKLKKTKAKKRRQVRNPFTGETVWAKPKKAGTKITFRGSKK